MAQVRNLILVLGDQLTPTVSSLAGGDPAQDRVLMAELHDEASYVRHHKKKLAFLFSAMRHFAEELRGRGWTVDYLKLDSPHPHASFTAALRDAVARHRPQRVRVTEAGEWRVAHMMADWSAQLGLPVDILADSRFLCSPVEFKTWARGRKQLRMEYFYRDMRRRTGLLMDGDQPAGGQWNFDADNRKPANADLFMPRPRTASAGCDHQRGAGAGGGALRRTLRRTHAVLVRGDPRRMPRPPRPRSSKTRCRASAITRTRCWAASHSSTTPSSPSISTAAARSLARSAGRWRPRGAPAACRSTPPRASSARSSAGANTCAASTG
jgi:hypothetical protein